MLFGLQLVLQVVKSFAEVRIGHLLDFSICVPRRSQRLELLLDGLLLAIRQDLVSSLELLSVTENIPLGVVFLQE